MECAGFHPNHFLICGAAVDIFSITAAQASMSDNFNRDLAIALLLRLFFTVLAFAVSALGAHKVMHALRL